MNFYFFVNSQCCSDPAIDRHTAYVLLSRNLRQTLFVSSAPHIAAIEGDFATYWSTPMVCSTEELYHDTIAMLKRNWDHAKHDFERRKKSVFFCRTPQDNPVQHYQYFFDQFVPHFKPDVWLGVNTMFCFHLFSCSFVIEAAFLPKFCPICCIMAMVWCCRSQLLYSEKQSLHTAGAHGVWSELKDIMNIQSVVNITLQSHAELWPSAKYLFLKVADRPSAPIEEHFAHAAEFIADSVNRGEPVLVHCEEGVPPLWSLSLPTNYPTLPYPLGP